jgi:hypothetical protein
VGGFDQNLAAFNDVDFVVRALDADHKLRVNQTPLVEQAIHDEPQVTKPSQLRLAALERFMAKHGGRMSRKQRRLMAVERHQILKHLAQRRRDRLAHLVADVVLSSPMDLYARGVRRLRLRGGYD